MQVQIHKDVEAKLRRMMENQRRSGAQVVAILIDNADSSEPGIALNMHLFRSSKSRRKRR